MVSGKTSQRKTLVSFWILVCLCLMVGGFIFILLGDENYNDEGAAEIADLHDEGIEVEPQEEVVEKLPIEINLQNVVDNWANSVGGNRSVLIYDLDRDETIGSYNPSESYAIASLYKLFVVYEGYRRVQNGAWSGESVAGSTGKTILQCLDLAIRESDSPCAETLLSMIGYANLASIMVNDFGLINSSINSFLSNATDILKMMQVFYQHADITNGALLAQMKDSFLNQPVTAYDWRQGLPSGFTKASVYNKVGWDYNAYGDYWDIFHDAAIIDFPEYNRHFIVVVMTNRVPYQSITKLGQMIENEIINTLNG